MSRKQRYYMRGIGVGILICALILIISRINTPAEISDEEIVSRARALGMVDPGDLSLSAAEDLGNGEAAALAPDNNTGSTSDAVTDTDQSGNTGSTADAGTDTDQNADNVSTDDAGTTADQSGDNDSTAEAGTDANQNADNGSTSDTVTDAGQSGDVETVPDGNSYAVLVVERGNSSDVVARRLESLGVITDPVDFDKYLVANGYASRISVGTFQIPYGSDYDYIARAITRSL
ncbi:MAG: MSCRAMM family adhesin SdrC [Lachnospiraceae bacterium]|nr:MSCRAMM family adhesin SdrC [Lachnospiraceae bacterium]